MVWWGETWVITCRRYRQFIIMKVPGLVVVMDKGFRSRRRVMRRVIYKSNRSIQTLASKTKGQETSSTTTIKVPIYPSESTIPTPPAHSHWHIQWCYRHRNFPTLWITNRNISTATTMWRNRFERYWILIRRVM